MTPGVLVDSAAPTLEVRIYRDSRLLGRERCANEEAVTLVVDRWSDVANLFVVADDRTPGLPPDPTAREPWVGAEETGTPLASRPLPCRGTE
jgi:hypothetical protein